MSIKSKLLTIWILICSILGVFAGFMVWSYQKSSRQVHIVHASLENLYAVSRKRSAIINQTVHSMHYLLTGKEEDKKEYEDWGIIARRAHTEWVDAIRRSMELGLDKKGAMERAREMDTAYNKAKETVAQAFDLADAGKNHEAYRLLEDEIEHRINHAITKMAYEAVAEEIKEVNEAYDEVLIRLGQPFKGSTFYWFNRL